MCDEGKFARAAYNNIFDSCKFIPCPYLLVGIANGQLPPICSKNLGLVIIEKSWQLHEG